MEKVSEKKFIFLVQLKKGPHLLNILEITLIGYLKFETFL